MTYHGEYGGRVLRKFVGGGVQWIPGAAITPEQAMEWPLANRKALYNTHKVEWYGPPADAPVQRPAPSGTQKAKGKEAPAPGDKTKETKTSAPAASPSSRNRRRA